MKRFINLCAIVVLLLVTAISAPHAAAEGPSGKDSRPLHPATGQVIPGHYIVVLNPGQDPGASAARAGAQPQYVYTAVLDGFAAALDSSSLAALQQDPSVAYIEPDQVVGLVGTQLMDAAGDPWGLDRIDQHTLPLDGSYTYAGDGTGVNAYIIDTGIEPTHADFGGRASADYDSIGGLGVDCNGHGTHVAGTIGGSTYGVAKNVALHGVRVLDCGGSGSTATVIAGMDWVSMNAVRPAVANMSLGGGFSASLNSAATNLAANWIFLAVAAGNSNADACSYSPASAPGTYTVAASDRTDTRAWFSNFGGCVDGYGPGVDIKSDWLGGGTNTISGTSMATPHVAGVAALYKGLYGDAPSPTIVSWLYGTATAGVIFGNPPATPNLLLFGP